MITAAKAFGKPCCSAVSGLQSDSIFHTQAFAVEFLQANIFITWGENAGEGILFATEITLD